MDHQIIVDTMRNEYFGSIMATDIESNELVGGCVFLRHNSEFIELYLLAVKTDR
jgi:hypothetical protein